MTKVNRRKFIKAAGVTAAAGTTALAAPAIAQGIQEWKMVMSWPKGFPGLGTAAQNFANRLEVAMDGKVKVKLFGGGELVPALKCLDALQEGTADLYHSADYYYVGKSKAYAFFCSVPFGMTVAESDAWMHHGGGQKLWDELSAQFGVKPFLGGNTGVQMGGWFRKEMKTIEDFKGLKMRIPGLGGDVIRALGGTPVTLAGAEILPALQAGTVDAAEWVGPWNDLAFGLYKVAKYYYHPGFHEPSTAEYDRHPQAALGQDEQVREGDLRGGGGVAQQHCLHRLHRQQLGSARHAAHQAQRPIARVLGRHLQEGG